ncbi:hypothetical protein U1Q18_050917 [Sarracenia purpurea var. burkii]
MPRATSELSTKPDSQTHADVSYNDATEIALLPARIFTVEVSDFLSPDIFSQANPFDYFLKKQKKLPIKTVRKINDAMWMSIWKERFPQGYIPYAKLLMSFLGCLLQLEDIEGSTRIIQRFVESNNVSTPPAIFTIDHVISPLFSSYVFSDKNPPVRLLRKLLQIPENEISTLSSRVEKLLNHRQFPRRYSRFTKCLLTFLKAEYLLPRLKKNLVEIQRVVTLSIPQVESDSNNFQVDEEDKLQTEDTDSSTKPINSSIISTKCNNDPAANILQGKCIKKEVLSFLPPEIFSESNPLVYFFVKAMKLQKDILQQTNFFMIYYLDRYIFPRRYIPYAELASSVISCLISLENINKIIDKTQRAKALDSSSYPGALISKLDPELSTFFTDDIFSKGDPLLLLFSKLLRIPENEVSNTEIRLQKLLKNASFPPRYSGYANCLLKFLQDETLLPRLKDNITEMQRTLKSNSSTSDQPNSIIVQE